MGEIRESVNRTLEALPSTPVRSLADIIKFNDEHPDLQAGLGKRILTGQFFVRWLMLNRTDVSYSSAGRQHFPGDTRGSPPRDEEESRRRGN